MKLIIKIRYILIPLAFALFLFYATFIFYFNDKSSLNEIGDSFGIFNAFFSALSVLLIYETLNKQQEEIKQTQIQYADEKMINLVYKHIDYLNVELSKVQIENYYSDVNSYIATLTKKMEDSVYFKKYKSIEVFLEEHEQDFISAQMRFKKAVISFSLALKVIETQSKNENTISDKVEEYKELFIENIGTEFLIFIGYLSQYCNQYINESADFIFTRVELYARTSQELLPYFNKLEKLLPSKYKSQPFKIMLNNQN
ncbi:MAG: hypothetical protein O9294_18645 [Cytophagales bacterium]|nr:hypothetical protein [Cytophagales bacterium]